MMSLPLYCKQHLGENRPCFVYLDDKARKLRCLRATPQGETTIGVSAGGRSLGVDVGATAKERSQRLQHFFRTYCGDPLLWQRRCGIGEVPADVDGGALFKTRPLTRALMERPACWTSGLESTNPGAAKPAKRVVLAWRGRPTFYLWLFFFCVCGMQCWPRSNQQPRRIHSKAVILLELHSCRPMAHSQ